MAHQELLDEFNRVIRDLTNPDIDAWKQAGKPVVGYFCSYVPTELLTAAGILPLRLRGTGSSDSAVADALLSSRICTYVRHTLSQALAGNYDFLDGVICLNTCDHVRRAFDVWRHKTSVKFHGFISVPRNARESLYPYFREEIENLLAQLQSHFACQIDEERIRDAIARHNRVRERLGRIDALRAGPVPRLSGSGMLQVVVASQLLTPEAFIEKADALLAALQAEPPGQEKPRARLMLVGTELDEPEFVEAVESQGARVVTDSLCYGSRTWTRPVDQPANDPLEAVCRRYFFQVPCARMIGNFPDRWESMLSSIREHRVDGVVLQRLKFCDPWGAEAHHLRRRMKQQGIPLLILEREYGQVNPGQVKTRIQAFMELIESKSRRRETSSKTAKAEEVSP